MYMYIYKFKFKFKFLYIYKFKQAIICQPFTSTNTFLDQTLAKIFTLYNCDKYM